MRWAEGEVVGADDGERAGHLSYCHFQSGACRYNVRAQSVGGEVVREGDEDGERWSSRVAEVHAQRSGHATEALCCDLHWCNVRSNRDGVKSSRRSHRRFDRIYP